jgi:signal transduction histidine kinase
MRNKLANWVLRHFTSTPAFGRPLATAIIITLVLAIGVVDAVAGINISFAVFYTVPVVISLAWLGWRSAIMVAVGSVIVRLIGDYAAVGLGNVPPWTLWNSLSALIIFLFNIWVLNELLQLKSQLEKRVEERTAQLQEAARARRQLELELLAVGSRERNAIGHELHDDICQHLVATAMAAQVLTKSVARHDEALANDARAIVGWLEEGADKTRKLARGLLLAEIEPGKLAERLAELCEEFDGEVACVFDQDGEALVADAGTAAQLFRIGQEALRNALKHADARRVVVRLDGSGSGVRLTVEDDGSGLLAGREDSMGIRVMSNRAHFIGGEFEVDAVPGRGTRVACWLPHKAER